jgi:lysozyme
MKLNNITDENSIFPGQVLKIRKISVAPVSSAPVSGGTTRYTVVAGDSLSGIAARFGTTTRNLMNLNNITNANLIRIGQVLIISETSGANGQPAPASTSSPSQTYTVVAGDSLSGIAARFGTTTRNLMNLNNITNANLIRVGQVLILSETSVGNSQPAPAPTPSQTYTVVAGDSLSGIAARFGTTTFNLMTLNGITNANLIRVGQVLKLR